MPQTPEKIKKLAKKVVESEGLNLAILQDVSDIKDTLPSLEEKIKDIDTRISEVGEKIKEPDYSTILNSLTTLSDEIKKKDFRGLKGENGIDGKDGKDGKDGLDGKNGIDGKDGLNGRDGRDGIDGKDGKNFDTNVIVKLEKKISDIESIAKINSSLPITTMFVNGTRAKNLSFSGATVSYNGDTANVSISGGTDIWEMSGIVTRQKDANSPYATSDLLFGSPTLDYDSDATHASRLFFDKSKGAFRVGLDSTGLWDTANVGNYSTAFGLNTKSSGLNSMSWGDSTEASGDYSTAFGGIGNVAGGNYSFVGGGLSNQASGTLSFSWGNDVYSAGNYSGGFGFTDFSGLPNIINGAYSFAFMFGDLNDGFSGTIINNPHTFAVLGAAAIINPGQNVLSADPRAVLDLGYSTNALLLPQSASDSDVTTPLNGNTMTEIAGMIRYNTSSNTVKFYNGSTWNTLIGTITGSDTHVLFFDGANNPAGDAGLTYNKTTDSLTALGTINSGTADPMTVNGSAITANFQANSDTLSIIESHTHSATAASGGTFYMARSRGTTAAPTVVQNLDTLGILSAVGYDGTDYATSSAIIFSVNGTPGNNDMPGKITFYTSADGSQTLVDRGSFNASGQFKVENLTANEMIYADTNKNLTSMAVATYPSLTEMTYVKGVTSSIQTQLNAKISTTLGAFGSTPNANGATITGTTLNLEPASGTFPGGVSTTTQTFKGSKTFSQDVKFNGTPAITIGTYGGAIRGTASGNITLFNLEQANGDDIATWIGNSTLDYSILEIIEPGGTINADNFEFSVLGPLYATNGLLANSSTLMWTRTNLSNGIRIGAQVGPVIFFNGGFATTTERMRIASDGRVAISGSATPLTAPTAYLHLAAGAAGASNAPLKFTTGTVNTTAEAGAFEYATPDIFFTPGSAIRYNIPLVNGAGTQGDIIYASGASIYSRLAKNTSATRYLSNTGTSNNPAWAQVDLTNGVTGILPVGNGGTGTSTPASTFTPTPTGVANINSITMSNVKYIQIGNMVICSGEFTITVTAAATLTQFYADLPVTVTVFNSTDELSGNFSTGLNDVSGKIYADTTNKAALFEFTPTGAPAGDTYSYMFMYSVQ